MCTRPIVTTHLSFPFHSKCPLSRGDMPANARE